MINDGYALHFGVALTVSFGCIHLSMRPYDFCSRLELLASASFIKGIMFMRRFWLKKVR